MNLILIFFVIFWYKPTKIRPQKNTYEDLNSCSSWLKKLRRFSVLYVEKTHTKTKSICRFPMLTFSTAILTLSPIR